MIHHFDKSQRAYTSCFRLPMNVKHTGNWGKVTCQDCLAKLADLSPEEIDRKLGGLPLKEALDFLEILGHIGAAEIYTEGA